MVDRVAHQAIGWLAEDVAPAEKKWLKRPLLADRRLT
jgi:hypothetical protein